MQMMNLNMPAAAGKPAGGQPATGAQPAGLVKLATGKTAQGSHAAAGKGLAKNLFSSLLGSPKTHDATAEGTELAAGLAGLLAVPALPPQTGLAPEVGAKATGGAAVHPQPPAGVEMEAAASPKLDAASAKILEQLTQGDVQPPQEATTAQLAAAQTAESAAATKATTAAATNAAATTAAAAAGLTGNSNPHPNPAMAMLQDQPAGSKRTSQPSLTASDAPRANPEQPLQPTSESQLLVSRQSTQRPENRSGSADAGPDQDPRFARLLKPETPPTPTPQPSLRQQHEPLHQSADPATTAATAVAEGLHKPAKPAHQASQPDLQVKPELTVSHHAEPGQTTASAELRPAPVEAQPATRPTSEHIQLASGRQVSEQEVLNQVVMKMTGSHNGHSGKATLHLHPAELGQIKLDISVDHDRLKAHMVTQSTQVQEVLEKHLPRLREALEQQGLHIDSFEVNVESRQPQSDPWQQQFARQQQAQWNRSHPQAPAAALAPQPHPVSRPATVGTGNGAISLHI